MTLPDGTEQPCVAYVRRLGRWKDHMGEPVEVIYTTVQVFGYTMLNLKLHRSGLAGSGACGCLCGTCHALMCGCGVPAGIRMRHRNVAGEPEQVDDGAGRGSPWKFHSGRIKGGAHGGAEQRSD